MKPEEADILRDLWRFSVSERYTDKEIREALDKAIKALKERPHGEWIYDMFDENYHCSECNRVGATISNFCPNCGADMRQQKGGDGQ